MMIVYIYSIYILIYNAVYLFVLLVLQTVFISGTAQPLTNGLYSKRLLKKKKKIKKAEPETAPPPPLSQEVWLHSGSSP